MNSKSIEYFQQEQLNDNITLPSIDTNYIIFNRAKWEYIGKLEK